MVIQDKVQILQAHNISKGIIIVSNFISDIEPIDKNGITFEYDQKIVGLSLQNKIQMIILH